ncbi:hypothetical protein GOP47_0010961 [Adiantum capillus-veneris]|uniref:Uncharacterized protein n=1 Tax=Adiantum capillus-veneris TaxID=13818 RepID=A0A9D4UVK1_ADICA|nr:hypothetical protein GOP47_0010961 [Adiantum capillus-veneris]
MIFSWLKYAVPRFFSNTRRNEVSNLALCFCLDSLSRGFKRVAAAGTESHVMAAAVLKRLGRRSSLRNGLLQAQVAAATSNPNSLLRCSLPSKACKVGHISFIYLRFGQPLRGLHEQALAVSVASDHHHYYEDAESQAAASAIQTHLQKHSQAYLLDAVAVVAHAPFFVKKLVNLVKQKSQERVEPVNENTKVKTKKRKMQTMPSLQGLSFEKQVLVYLSYNAANINALEPILESVGMESDRRETLLQKLTAESVEVQSLLFVIRWLEKLGLSRSRVGDIIEKETGVLSYKSDEIEAGFAMLKDLSLPEREIHNLIMKYPLILKAEVVDNIAALREELSEIPSRDVVLRKALICIPGCVHRYEKGCADGVLHFLRGYGLTEERLDRILQRHFRLPFLDVEKKLKDKVKFLKDVGVPRPVIGKVLRRSPGFLFFSLEENLKPRLDYFKSLGISEAEFATMVSRYPSIFSASLDNKVKPAVEELKTLGLNEEGLKKLVVYRPSLFSHKLGGDISSLVSGLKETDYSDPQKVTAFMKLYTRGIDHKKKCEECLMRYGLSESEAKQVLDKEPGIFGYKEKSLVERLDHLTQTLGLPIQNVLSAPCYLSFGFKSRFLRRQRVLAYMKSKGLLTSGVSLKHVLSPSNKQFYHQYVKPHGSDRDLLGIWYKEREGMGKEDGLNFILDYPVKAETEAQVNA